MNAVDKTYPEDHMQRAKHKFLCGLLMRQHLCLKCMISESEVRWRKKSQVHALTSSSTFSPNVFVKYLLVFYAIYYVAVSCKLKFCIFSNKVM